MLNIFDVRFYPHLITSPGAHEVVANGRRLAAGWSSFCCIFALHCGIHFIITLEMLDWSLVFSFLIYWKFTVIIFVFVSSLPR